MLPCLDEHYKTFNDQESMLQYHTEVETRSEWRRMPVNDIEIAPLDASSALLNDRTQFDSSVSDAAIEDAARNTGLAARIRDVKTYNVSYFPVRNTAVKSLLDRAKISGAALSKLEKPVLARILNDCLKVWSKPNALILKREQKITAFHSGDFKDYSVLPVPKLLDALLTEVNTRFPGNEFVGGYADHAITTGEWRFPGQRDDLLGAYEQKLKQSGKSINFSKLMPGIRFTTSDAGLSAAGISALLLGERHPIPIGSIISVQHRRQSSVKEFADSLPQIYAQFGDAVKKMEQLLDIHLDYPINAMAAICKKLCLPKQAALEAINQYGMAIGDNPASAHDVYWAIQEILYILHNDGASQSKLFSVEESIARALTLRWRDYDFAQAVNW